MYFRSLDLEPSTHLQTICEDSISAGTLADVIHRAVLYKLSHIFLSFLLLNVSFLVLPLSLYDLSLSMCSFESVLSLSLSLSLCLSLSALPLTVCVSVFSAFSMSLCVSSVSGPSCQCPAVVSLGAAYLGSLHSHGGGQRRLCCSVPHQSDCSQLRQSPSVLLPLH